MKKSILFSLALIGLTSTPAWAMDPGLLPKVTPPEPEAPIREKAKPIVREHIMGRMKPVKSQPTKTEAGTQTEDSALIERDEKGNNALTRADNAEDVSAALANRPMDKSVFSNQNDKGKTALIRRAKADDLESVQILLAHSLMDKTMLAKQDDTGKNALMYAAANGNEKIVKELLESEHMDPPIFQHRNKAGDNVLTLAATADSEVLSLFLLSEHMNKTLFSNQNDEGETALIRRAKADDLKSVQILLKHSLMNRPLLAKQDDKGKNALMHAAANNNVEIVEALLASEYMSKSIIEQKDDAENNAVALAIEVKPGSGKIYHVSALSKLLDDPRVDEGMIRFSAIEIIQNFPDAHGLIQSFVSQEWLRKNVLLTKRRPPFGKDNAENEEIYAGKKGFDELNTRRRRVREYSANDPEHLMIEVAKKEISERFLNDFVQHKKYEQEEQQKKLDNPEISLTERIGIKKKMQGENLTLMDQNFIFMSNIPMPAQVHISYITVLDLFSRAARARKLAEKELEWAKNNRRQGLVAFMMGLLRGPTTFDVAQWVMFPLLDFGDAKVLNDMWNLKLEILEWMEFIQNQQKNILEE